MPESVAEEFRKYLEARAHSREPEVDSYTLYQHIATLEEQIERLETEVTRMRRDYNNWQDLRSLLREAGV